MNGNKALRKQIRNERCEHHSNLALLTTVMAMAGFVVLMFVYMGEHNPANIELAVSASVCCAAAFWIGAAAFAYNAVKKKKKYLLEYVLYCIIMGFGLFVMYDMPIFMLKLLEGTYFYSNWASSVFRILAILLVIYSLVSIAWHVILATPRKSKSK